MNLEVQVLEEINTVDFMRPGQIGFAAHAGHESHNGDQLLRLHAQDRVFFKLSKFLLDVLDGVSRAERSARDELDRAFGPRGDVGQVFHPPVPLEGEGSVTTGDEWRPEQAMHLTDIYPVNRLVTLMRGESDEGDAFLSRFKHLPAETYLGPPY
ncbi:hypothetical protein T439DRAFT_48701 [Meredithblackwellia eburnea MCA 4105]